MGFEVSFTKEDIRLAQRSVYDNNRKSVILGASNPQT